jgi:hypothetical protein
MPPPRLLYSHCMNHCDMSWTSGMLLLLVALSVFIVNVSRYNAPKVRTTLLMPGHIQTPMFSRTAWPRSRIWKFFVPSLPPITVAKAVIRALDNQHSETIYMPFYANFAFALRAMPSFARDFCQWVRVTNGVLSIRPLIIEQLAAADTAMKPFVKVSGRRPEEGPAPPAASNGVSRTRSD